MSMTLAEALANVELETGRTYRVQVNDRFIELKVLNPADITENDVMLDGWTALPAPPMVTRIMAKKIDMLLPTPLTIIPDDLKPE